MSPTFGVVDLFAGPGGLSEGFASFRAGARAPFQTCLSVEKEASAHRTLTLRVFLHSLQARFGAPPKAYVDFHAGRIPEPDWGDVDAESWAAAREKTWRMELGASAADEKIGAAIDQLRRRFDETVLIGGPPCQAYSLVGRARSKGKRDYVPEEDARHYLFREYIRVLERARPAAFVMENVKGMLSSTVESRRVFEMLMEDLSSLGKKGDALYELFAIRVEDGQAVLRTAKAPSDFIVRSEAFGVPQRRHRVIIVGLRSDVARNVGRARVRLPGAASTLREAIGDLPPLRSGLSRQREDDGLWRATAAQAADILAGLDFARSGPELRRRFADLSRRWRTEPSPSRASSALPQEYGRQASPLKVWLERPGMQALAQHETRSHMVADLGRYMFAAAFGEVFGFSPKATDFPPEVSPAHRNWRSGIFSDRFRVQLANEPSTTITSHISKDGHYFIHPDPTQCRSLTVREAARLQGFPDDYVFLGSRTEQYVQVGNAVPPLLAHGVAELVWGVLKESANSQLPDQSEQVPNFRTVLDDI